MKKVNKKISKILFNSSFEKTLFHFILLVIFYINPALLNAQCGGAELLNGTQTTTAYYANPTGCGTSFSGTIAKYKDQSFYIPWNPYQNPVITVKIALHVFKPSYSTPIAFDGGSGIYNGDSTLRERLTLIEGTNGRFSDVRNASFNAPNYFPQYLYDSNIQFELVNIYYYVHDKFFYGTDNGLPADNRATIGGAINFLYNPSSTVFTTGGAMSWIQSQNPERIDEGIAILMFNDCVPVQRSTVAPSGGGVPYVCISHVPGIDDSSTVNNNKASIKTLRHELGHCFGLLHPYYGGNCYPGYPSYSPETGDSITKYLDCSNPDYLSDLFPSSVPNASFASYPYPNGTYSNGEPHCPNPPLNVCQSVYENVTAIPGYSINSNNMMSDNGYTATTKWITPLQMGRRIRAMHIKSNAYPFYGVGTWGNVRFYAKEMTSMHSYPLQINVDETWDFDVQMYRDIIVKSGNTLKITCKVAMATDGRIIVEKGAKLIVDGPDALITGWCKKTPIYAWKNNPLWFGIEVRGDPNLNQVINNTTGYCQYQGIVEITNGAIIANANNAVYTGYDYNGQLSMNSTGGIVRAYDSYFINNVRDLVLFENYTSMNSSKVINCRFQTNGEIGKDGNGNVIYPQEHVKLYKHYGLYFDHCIFENTTTTVNASNKGVGIYSTDSYFNVGFNAAGMTQSTSCTFSLLSVGVWIDNINPLYPVNIKNSVFRLNELKGIIAENCNYLAINSNTVFIDYSQIGLYLYQSKYYKVQNNTFSLWNTVRHAQTGIAVFQSGNGSHEIYRNTFKKLKFGIIALDNNGGGSQGMTGLKMNCNDFSAYHQNGWDIALTKSISTMPTIDPYQSAPGVATAFTLVRNIYGAPFTPTAPLKNKFFVDASSTQSILHDSNIDSNTQPNNPNPQSSSQVNVIPSVFSLNYDVHCLAFQRSAPDRSGDMSIDLQALTNYVGELSANNSQGYNDFEIQSTISSKLNLLLTDTLTSSIDSVISIFTNNQSNMDDADIQLIFAYIKKKEYTVANSLIAALGSNRTDWKNLLNKITTIEQDSLAALSIVNNASTISFLEGYANIDGRDGQACAQALLKFALGVNHEFPLIYPEEPISGARNFQTTDQIEELIAINDENTKVFPNPMNSGFTISNQANGEGLLTIKVIDLLGKIIYTNFMNKGSEKYFSIINCPNGMYHLTVIDGEENTIFQIKLIKQ